MTIDAGGGRVWIDMLLHISRWGIWDGEAASCQKEYCDNRLNKHTFVRIAYKILLVEGRKAAMALSIEKISAVD